MKTKGHIEFNGHDGYSLNFGRILSVILMTISATYQYIHLHLRLNARDATLVLRNRLGLKFPIPVSGDIHLKFPVMVFEYFRRMHIPCVCTAIWFPLCPVLLYQYCFHCTLAIKQKVPLSVRSEEVRAHAALLQPFSKNIDCR